MVNCCVAESDSSLLNRRKLLRRGFGFLSCVIAAPLIACGNQNGSKEHTVRMIEMRFSPDHLEIAVGDTVIWINESQFVHTVTTDPANVRDPAHVMLPSGVATFDSGNLAHEERWAQLFETAGDYRYCCSPHELAGMMGTVTVKSAS